MMEPWIVRTCWSTNFAKMLYENRKKPNWPLISNPRRSTVTSSVIIEPRSMSGRTHQPNFFVHHDLWFKRTVCCFDAMIANRLLAVFDCVLQWIANRKLQAQRANNRSGYIKMLTGKHRHQTSYILVKEHPLVFKHGSKNATVKNTFRQ